MKRIRGIALIQVLLMTMIISLFAMYFTSTARLHIEQSQSLKTRVEAQLAAYSVQNQLIFATLANQWSGDTALLPDYWELLANNNAHYFYSGQSISLTQQVSVEMQDIGGKLPIQFPGHPVWPLYLTYRGLSQGEIQQFIHQLKDFQDPDRLSQFAEQEPERLPNGLRYLNSPIEHEYWLNSYLLNWPNLSSVTHEDMHVVTAYQMSVLGLNTALLQSIFGFEQADYIRTLIQQNELDALKLSQLLPEGIDSESLGLLPTQNRQYSITVTKDNVLWRQSVNVRLQALQSEPFIVIGKQF